MKRLLSYLFIFIFISLVYVPVNATSDYYKDIRISFNICTIYIHRTIEMPHFFYNFN